jgi:hypothetical protein
MYTALVLDQLSHDLLVKSFLIPQDWEIIAHHMTINLGNAQNGPAKDILNYPAKLKVTEFAQNDRVMAVKVETDVPSTNAIKHITIAVNRNVGAKPFESNKLDNWQKIEPIILSGTIQEVE